MVIDRASSMVNTPPQGKVSKTDYDPKTMMYSAYDTPHKLCNI